MKAVISIEALERYARGLRNEKAEYELMDDDRKGTGVSALGFAIHSFKSIVLESVGLALEDEE